MYIITHLPSKTFYGIHKDDKTFVVCCKKFDDAMHIGNSYTTYKYLHKVCPKNEKVFFYSKTHGVYDALNYDLFITNIEDEIDQYMEDFSRNHLGVLFVHDLFPKLHSSELRLKKTKYSEKHNLDKLYEIE